MLIPKKWIIIIVIVMCVMLVSFIQSSQDSNEVDMTIAQEETTVLEDDSQVEQGDVQKEWLVDIKGAINIPGVYHMKEGDRVVDVIETAGGLTDDADSYQVNLAQLVYDEMVIVVPFQQENGEVSSVDMTIDQDKIRINHASVDELTVLPGIGNAKAQTIIDYRDEHGPFQSPEDLLNISGIGEKTLERIRDDIMVP
ncbi:competence protein ComEA [Alkalibacillus flavidus]|uniref:Competence protein ComEA n=1 Tax=Alkalibacillus flavidus TaxID=546021 RepID=A0ABV2KSE5_9BACI